MGVVCVCACVYVFLSTLVEVRANTECFYLFIFLLFSPEAGSLPEPKAHQFGQAGVPGSVCLSPPMLTSQELEAMPSF